MTEVVTWGDAGLVSFSGCNLAEKWVPTDFFCLGRKNHSVSVNWCAKKRGKKGGGVRVRVCVHALAPKKFLESSR